jgi:hypothetical protein
MRMLSSPHRRLPLGLRIGRLLLAGLAVLPLASCAALSSGGPPRQKGEPQWSSCITGSDLEKSQNCAEYCATKNLACQNFGCGHSENPSTRYGGASYGGGLCVGAPSRSYQCNDPFLQDGAVRCCCVGL